MADALKSWLRLHAAGEKLLAKKIAVFLKAQGQRVADAIGDNFTAAAAKAAIDVDADTELLLSSVAAPIIGFIGTAAERVLKQAKKPKSSKAFDGEALKNFKLPAWVEAEIEKSFGLLEEQDYWQDIQKATANSVADAVKRAIDEGMSMRKAAKMLKDDFAFSPVRAAAIARTETTGAYNLGHQASYDFLAQSGDIGGKEWLGVADKDQRESHAEANGQIVPVDQDFIVGGESAKYPGDPSLSAAERVNCRCTTAGVFE